MFPGPLYWLLRCITMSISTNCTLIYRYPVIKQFFRIGNTVGKTRRETRPHGNTRRGRAKGRPCKLCIYTSDIERERRLKLDLILFAHYGSRISMVIITGKNKCIHVQ